MRPLERIFAIIVVIGIGVWLSKIEALAKYTGIIRIIFIVIVVANILALPHDIMKQKVLKSIERERGEGDEK